MIDIHVNDYFSSILDQNPKASGFISKLFKKTFFNKEIKVIEVKKFF